METIRIGNDISVQWTILHDNVPEPLEGRDLKVILSNSFEKIEIKDFLLLSREGSDTLRGLHVDVIREL